MFKWRRGSKSQEPKTPRLPKITLHPDPRFAPISYQQQYDPNSYSNYAQVAPTKKVIKPMLDPRYSHREPTSTKPRSRSMSTPTRELKGMLDDPPFVFFFDLYVKPRHRFGLTHHKVTFLTWTIRTGGRGSILLRHLSHQWRVRSCFAFFSMIQ